MSTNVTTTLPYSIELTTFFALISTLVSIATVLGNILVFTAFVVERSIRVPSNYFLASLALTDLIIGIFSMNLFTLYLLYGYWPLGITFCKIWLFLDYTACLTSQYTVLFITVDRFCSVKFPARYRELRNKNNFLAIVASTWIIPATLFLLFIVGWPVLTGNIDKHPHDECFAEFTTYPVFNTIFTICYYWITLAVMCILYGSIYQVAWKLHQKSIVKRKRTATLMAMTGHAISRIGVDVDWAPSKGDDKSEDDDEDESRHIQNSSVIENLGSSPMSMRQLSPLDRTCKNEKTSLVSLSPEKPLVNHPLSMARDNLHATGSSTKELVIYEKTCEELPPSILSGHDESNEFTVYYKQTVPGWITSVPEQKLTASELSTTSNETPHNSKDILDGSIPYNDNIHLNPDSCISTNILELHSPDVNTPLPLYSANMPISYPCPKTCVQRLSQCFQSKMKSTGSKLVTSRQSKTNSRSKTENRAWKALRTISIILGAFVICWTPYHVLVLIEGFCAESEAGKSCVNSTLYSLSYWLYYMNSHINPFCYALANKQFKITFLRILKGDCRLL